jgi:dihydroorotate dehydrogenase (NAD+) catalytic subunit
MDPFIKQKKLTGVKKNNNLLSVKIDKLVLKNPLLTCSGTSGSSHEISFLEENKYVLDALGAFVTKGVTLNPSPGNKPPRIVEMRSANGIINSIGLQNKGAKLFVKEDLPNLLKYNLPIIVNISASSIEEFGDLAKYLNEYDINKVISGIEINLSCPNIKKGGIAFGTDPQIVETIVRKIKDNIDNRIILITKLTPNVTDITIPAKAAINGGTNVLSMINTLRAIAIDVERKKPFLGNKVGGLSGPCIKPVGLFMVYECYKKIRECHEKKIPIIGIGGISDHYDVLEYIMAGASAVGIGTQWFIDNYIFNKIHSDLSKYVNENNCSINSLIGIAHEEG